MRNGSTDRWLGYRDHHRAVQDRFTEQRNAEHKARDPLDFYWKVGVQAMRRDHHKLLDFNPKPEQFYNEGNYCGKVRQQW